jgi:uncharacterized protein
MTRAPLSPTPRSTPKRHGDRARSDRAELDAVLDEGLICHLGFVRDGAPVVLPTCYGRDGDTLFLHGSSGATSMMEGGKGVEVSVCVTLLDAIVYARSVFNHSANYRSVVVHGAARPLTTDVEKLHALEAITEHLAPGSWTHARQPDRKELAATAVLAIDLIEASLKVRTGPPGDDPEPGVWAGLLPVRQSFGVPESAPDADIDAPGHVVSRLA